MVFGKAFPLVGLALILVLHLVSPTVAQEEKTLKCYNYTKYYNKPNESSHHKGIECTGPDPACYKRINTDSLDEFAGCTKDLAKEFNGKSCLYGEPINLNLLCHCRRDGCNEGLGPLPNCSCGEPRIECIKCDNELDCEGEGRKVSCVRYLAACMLHQSLETKKVVKRDCGNYNFAHSCYANTTLRWCDCHDRDYCNKDLHLQNETENEIDECACGDFIETTTTNATGVNPGPSPPGPRPVTNSVGILALSPVFGIATVLLVGVLLGYTGK